MSEPRDSAAVAPLPDVRRRMNDGAALIAEGKAADAVELFRQAGTLQPEYPDAPLMEGIAHFLLGDPARAEPLLERALKLAPRRADILQNIGLVRGALGRTEAELAAFNEALDAEPRNPELHELLAQAQLRAGRVQNAVITLSDLLLLDPTNRGARHNLALMLIEAPYTSWSPEREALLLTLLMHDDVERQHLARAVGALIADRHKLLRGDEELPLAVLAADNLLLAALAALYFTDPVSEKLLTRTRARVLAELDHDGAAEPELLRLGAALALHAFSNEYAHVFNAEERTRSAACSARLSRLLDAGTAPGSELLATAAIGVALYAPLHLHPSADALAALPLEAVSAPLRPLLVRTLHEVRDELARAAAVPAFGSLKDATSGEVGAMYEDNPYPRWHAVGFVAPQPLAFALDSAFPGWPKPLWTDGRPFDVLIAGCGTGRHALRAATHYRGARVLGIDISRRSLGYAQRMAERLGIKNVEFLRCDLHELPKLGRRFQLIETIGSLETVADPRAGWQALRACLADDGLMHVGSYSESARRPVVRARTRIAALGLKGTPDDMRLFRQMVIDGALGEDGRRIEAIGDFHTLSGVRDFLFHVRENRFWLSDLRAHAQAVGLKFVGFHPLKREMREAFAVHDKDPAALRDLDVWVKLEETNQDLVARSMNLAMWFGWYEVARS
jgi:SAM-dependent methyltransferase/tetratricopeptide (TPR) repeat protein